MSSVTRWWWLRHAPVINPDGIVYGTLDLPPSLDDDRTIAATARQLPHPAVWLHTGLARTRETLAALAGARGVDDPNAVSVPGLLEQHLGQWQGRPSAEVFGHKGRRRDPFWRAPAAQAPPGGESVMAMSARVAAAILDLSDVHRGRDIICVAHAGTIRAALALALKLDGESALSFAIDPLSLTRIDLIHTETDALAWRVSLVNGGSVSKRSH